MEAALAKMRQWICTLNSIFVLLVIFFSRTADDIFCPTAVDIFFILLIIFLAILLISFCYTADN